MIRSGCRFSERKLDVDIIHYNTKLASMSVVGGIFMKSEANSSVLDSFFGDPQFGDGRSPWVPAHLRRCARQMTALGLRVSLQISVAVSQWNIYFWEWRS